MSTRIKVFIIDDSAVVRQVVTALLSEDPSIDVIGSASDPVFAQQKMVSNWPDVILLDIEMPRMDGISFLKKVMSERPTPVVICSTLTETGAATSVEALAAGAVEIITKPKVGLKDFLSESSVALIRAVKNAARARVGMPVTSAAHSPTARTRVVNNSAENELVNRRLAEVAHSVNSRAMKKTTDTVVALGTSTGGTQALEIVLTSLPEDCPGVVVVQHMPEKFTAAFADRLNRLCRCEVKEAVNGDRVRSGRVLIAPGGLHMQLKRSGAQYTVSVRDGPRVNRHKPSVDVLFLSIAKVAGTNAVGIIMTGMGDDGARGLLAMRQAGAQTIAQDQESCVVFGMPKEAIELGAVGRIMPLSAIGAAIAQFAQEP